MKFTTAAACAVACSMLMGCVAMTGSEEKSRELHEQVQAKLTAERQEDQLARAAKLHEMIRQTRKDNGRSPCLQSFAEGQEVARMRAKELTEWYSKYRPHGKGWYYTLTDELKGKVGIRKELRARNTSSPERVLKEWMRDKEAREVLLDRNMVRFGVGAYQSSSGTWFWTFEKY